MMMTYDYTTTSCYNGKLMAPVSPLYGNDGWNVSAHVDMAAQQAAPGKIIMGVPYYGIDLRVKTADREIYNARADYPNCDGGIETYSTITDPAYDAYHNDSSVRWNNTEKARWYVYQYSGFWRHGYYDDKDSLGAKYDFVRDRNLAGIGIWALNYDEGRSELWDLIRTKFQKVPFIVGFQSTASLSRIESIFSAVNLEVIDDLGNNVYRVSPVSGLSSDAISALRKYREVAAVDFENPRSIRTTSRTQ
jgi:GH18 family chitinase